MLQLVDIQNVVQLFMVRTASLAVIPQSDGMQYLLIYQKPTSFK